MRYLSNKTSWTDAMKDFTEKVLTEKFSNILENPLTAEVKVSKLDSRIKVDLSYGDYRAQALNPDFYIALIEVANRLKHIIIKHKDKNSDYHRLGTKKEIEGELELPLKVKEIHTVKITFEKAKEELAKTDYNFYVYDDIDEGCKAVAYKRHAGDIGILLIK